MNRVMQTNVLIFPFELFGSAGTAAGAELLGDALREMLADNRGEKVATRARTYNEHVRISRVAFEKTDDYADWRQRGRRAARRILDKGDFLVWVTGNHLGVLPVYDQLATPDADTLIVQFDAHLDIHNFHECTEEPSHGNFMLHCDGTLPPVINIGHRDLLLPANYVGKYYRSTISATSLALDPETAIRTLKKRADATTRIFLDIDCDVFDPAFFPAVSHPLPFGLASTTVLRCIDAVWSDKVVGMSISEFEPARDRNDRCLALLAWLLEHLLLRRYEGSDVNAR